MYIFFVMNSAFAYLFKSDDYCWSNNQQLKIFIKSLW